MALGTSTSLENWDKNVIDPVMFEQVRSLCPEAQITSLSTGPDGPSQVFIAIPLSYKEKILSYFPDSNVWQFSAEAVPSDKYRLEKHMHTRSADITARLRELCLDVSQVQIEQMGWNGEEPAKSLVVAVPGEHVESVRTHCPDEHIRALQASEYYALLCSQSRQDAEQICAKNLCRTLEEKFSGVYMLKGVTNQLGAFGKQRIIAVPGEHVKHVQSLFPREYIIPLTDQEYKVLTKVPDSGNQESLLARDAVGHSRRSQHTEAPEAV